MIPVQTNESLVAGRGERCGQFHRHPLQQTTDESGDALGEFVMPFLIGPNTFCFKRRRWQ